MLVGTYRARTKGSQSVLSRRYKLSGRGSSFAEDPALLLALIHSSAWKRRSANFRFTEFSEVRHTLATQSNTKDNSFGGYTMGQYVR